MNFAELFGAPAKHRIKYVRSQVVDPTEPGVCNGLWTTARGREWTETVSMVWLDVYCSPAYQEFTREFR